jgi:hypothetical protein
MSTINRISEYVGEGKLHPHDEENERHSLGSSYDGKSIIIHTDSRIDYMNKILKKKNFFNWSDMKTDDDLKTCIISIKPEFEYLVQCMLWIYSTPIDNMNECDYYLTDTLEFRYYPNRRWWRILPEKSDKKISFGDEWHKLLKFWRGTRTDRDRHDVFSSGAMIGFLLRQEVFLNFGSRYILEPNVIRRIYELLLKKCIKVESVPFPSEEMMSVIRISEIAEEIILFGGLVGKEIIVKSR